MKITDYLKEELNVLKGSILKEQMLSLLRKDCEEFLEELPKGRFLYRGTHQPFKNIVNPWLLKGIVKQNRDPRGMNKEEFETFNDILEKINAVKRNNAISTTSDYSNACFFSGPTYTYMIYPIGNYKYSWIEAFDVNCFNYINDRELSNDFRYYVKKKSKEGFLKYKVESDRFKSLSDDEMLVDVIKRFQKIIHTNEGLDKAITSGFEVWIECKEFYAINHKYKKELIAL